MKDIILQLDMILEASRIVPHDKIKLLKKKSIKKTIERAINDKNKRANGLNN